MSVTTERVAGGKPMLVIPRNTVIFDPDEINRVSLMFPTKDDAIIFYEYFKELLGQKESQ